MNNTMWMIIFYESADSTLLWKCRPGRKPCALATEVWLYDLVNSLVCQRGELPTTVTLKHNMLLSFPPHSNTGYRCNCGPMTKWIRAVLKALVEVSMGLCIITYKSYRHLVMNDVAAYIRHDTLCQFSLKIILTQSDRPKTLAVLHLVLEPRLHPFCLCIHHSVPGPFWTFQ